MVSLLWAPCIESKRQISRSVWHSLIFITRLLTVLCGLCFPGIRCEIISFRPAPRPAQNTRFNIPYGTYTVFLEMWGKSDNGLIQKHLPGRTRFRGTWLLSVKREETWQTQGEQMRPRQGRCWFGKMVVGIWKGPYLCGNPPAWVVLCSGVNAVHPKFMSFSNL